MFIKPKMVKPIAEMAVKGVKPIASAGVRGVKSTGKYYKGVGQAVKAHPASHFEVGAAAGQASWSLSKHETRKNQSVNGG